MENAWRMAAKSKVGMVTGGVWLAIGAAPAIIIAGAPGASRDASAETATSPASAAQRRTIRKDPSWWRHVREGLAYWSKNDPQHFPLKHILDDLLRQERQH